MAPESSLLKRTTVFRLELDPAKAAERPTTYRESWRNVVGLFVNVNSLSPSVAKFFAAMQQVQ